MNALPLSVQATKERPMREPTDRPRAELRTDERHRHNDAFGRLCRRDDVFGWALDGFFGRLSKDWGCAGDQRQRDKPQ